jgi:2,3-dihydroxybenzoate-AMP ligase
MLDGVTAFPAEFAARYAMRGYWEGRPLFDGFTGAFATYADQVAIIDENGPVTYRQLDERSAHLARVDPAEPALFLLSGGTTGIPS